MTEETDRTEKLGDDVLALILGKINDPSHRKSFSLVCKQWLRVEGVQRSTILVFEPELLPNFLPRFPNLLQLQASSIISNSSIQFLGATCPRIRVLNLNFKEKKDSSYQSVYFQDFGDEVYFQDFGDEGLCDLAKGCSDLRTVLLRKRKGVGDLGVASLVESSKSLRNLDLGWCREVSDKALESFRGLNSLESLNLQGCWLITDEGLAFLAEGSLCRTLKILNLAECDRITDFGLIHLKKMCCLEELNLAECGPKVTDNGGKFTVAAIFSLRILNLSWLVNVSDATLFALSEKCKNLEVLNLTGCELVSGAGIRALSGHGSLNQLVLAYCEYGMNGSDLEQLVLRCPNLEHIILDKRLRMWIPMSVQENILRKQCVLEWK
ncbi:EIN3-binding F-box protein 1-like [Primulina eburnea]|uniref:EIN3-binding F-box protein 1-like n=1 Tax=Primulina eburnea TaxID=1245227 RepID=UPI003C6C7D8A